MARKRQEGITTYPRYKLKMYRVFKIDGVPEALATEVATALTHARALGYGVFKTAWFEAKAILMRLGVPSAMWGLYKAFTNELINKVQRKKEATVEDIIAKWERNGLDPTVLREVANAVVQVVTVEVTKSAEKGG